MLCHINSKGLFKETIFFCCFLHLWEISFKSKFLSDNAVYMDIVDVANIFKILLFFVDKYGMFLYLVTEETELPMSISQLWLKIDVQVQLF